MVMQPERGIQETSRTRGNERENTGIFRCSEQEDILFHFILNRLMWLLTCFALHREHGGRAS
jgi:hypothetical protein